MKSLLVAAALGLAASSASAANLYWDAAGTTIDGASQGGTGTWTTGNWDTGTLEQLWVDGNAAFIGATSSITLNGGTSAAPSNISASSLTITGGTATLLSNIAPTTAGQPVAKLTLTGGGAINNAAVLVLGGSGSGSLANTRPVALILGGDITNTGGIGQVQVRGNSVVSSDGTAARTINANLNITTGDGTNSATFGYGTNTGNLTFTGNLTTDLLRKVNVLTGTTVTVNGTATTFELASQSSGYNGTFKVIGAVAANVSNTGGGTLELAGTVSGATVALTNSGTGTTVLSGANSYVGGTTVSNGTLKLGSETGAGTGSISLGSTATSAKLDTSLMSGAKSVANNIVLGNLAAAGSHTITAKSGSGNILTLSGNITGGGANTTLAFATDTAGDVAGKIILSGSSTYTGTTAVNSGTLVFDYTTNNTNKLGTGGLTINSGSTVRFKGNAGATTTQTASAGLTLGTGASIYLDTAAGQTLAVDFSGGTFTNPNAGLYVGTTGTGTAQLKLAGTTANTAFLSNVAYNNTFGATDASNAITASTVSALNTTATDLTTWAAGNTQYTTTGSAFTGTGVGSIAIDGITFKDAAANTVTIGTGNTLTLNKGVIVAPDVANNLSTITGGSLRAANGGPLTLFNANTQGDLTVASAIVDNGNSSLVKSGAGTVVLNNTGNTYAGGTSINGGILRADVAGSLGSGAVTVNATGVLRLGSVANSVYTINNAITLNGGGMLWSFEPGGAGITVSGQVTVTGTGNIIQTTYDNRPLLLSGGLTGTGTVTLRQSNDTAGTIGYAYQGGIIRLTGAGLGFTGTAIIQNQLSTAYPVSLENDDALKNATVQMGTNGRLRLSTASATVAGLTGTAGTIFNADTTARTFTVNNASANTFAGLLGDGTANGNKFALVKSGAGALTLSGTNTFTGGTTVSAGILELTGGNTGTGAGGIRGTANVAGGAQLRLSANDATGWATDATRLSVINLNGATDISGTGTLHVNTTANMTLGSAVINMTGASITGIANSNLDFFGGSSALNSLASSTTSVISGVALSAQRQGNTTFTVAKGTTASGIDLDILSVIKTSPSGDTDGTVLTKAGLGTLRLKAVNTAGSSGASGQTLSIDAGTLVTGNTAALGTYTVRLAGGTLQVGDASYIAAGASGTAVQTVNLGAGKNLVTAAGASILKFDSATSAIVLSGGGKYNFSAGTITLDLSNAFNSVGSYSLITGGTSNVDAASYAFSNVSGAFNYSFANGTLLVAIPEPSTYGLMGAGALAAVVAVRRRKRAAK